MNKSNVDIITTKYKNIIFEITPISNMVFIGIDLENWIFNVYKK